MSICHIHETQMNINSNTCYYIVNSFLYSTKSYQCLQIKKALHPKLSSFECVYQYFMSWLYFSIEKYFVFQLKLELTCISSDAFEDNSIEFTKVWLPHHRANLGLSKLLGHFGWDVHSPILQRSISAFGRVNDHAC